MRSGDGSGKVLGFCGGGAGCADAAEAEPDGALLLALASGGAVRGVAALGSPLPSPKRAGKTREGAPGSVE